MSFERIVGQTQAIHDLKSAWQQDRIPNAYLFVGLEGVGKKKTALALAMLLNCESPTSEHSPCGDCLSCRKIEHDTHTDIWLVAGEKNRIKIEQIRELQQRVRFAPQQAKTRVIIIDGAEHLTIEAANAFLKVLEEPPENNLFVLLSGSGSQLLDTIVSRCQRIPFAPLARQELSQLLISQHGVDFEEAWVLAGLGEGSVGQALTLQEALSEAEREDFLQSLPNLHRRPQGAAVALELAERVSRQNIPLYLHLLRGWYRDILLLREAGLPPEQLLNFDLADLLAVQARQMTLPALVRNIKAIEEAETSLSRNAAALLTLETLFLTLGRSS